MSKVTKTQAFTLTLKNFLQKPTTGLKKVMLELIIVTISKFVVRNIKEKTSDSSNLLVNPM